MEKKAYVKPVMESETFVPQTYVAACGDSGTIYKFKCNAGSRWKNYNVYLADGTPYATSGRDYGGCSVDYDSYHPCNDEHWADSDSGFLDGYMYEQNRRGQNTGSRINVVIWTDNFTDVHCTTDLVRDDWETAKS